MGIINSIREMVFFSVSFFFLIVCDVNRLQSFIHVNYYIESQSTTTKKSKTK